MSSMVFAGSSKMSPLSSNSGIRDNHSRGSVGDFLRQQLKPGANLDLVTAYFTIFAYDKLRTELNQLGRIRLLLAKPRSSRPSIPT
jgi:hypothetical protein